MSYCSHITTTTLTPSFTISKFVDENIHFTDGCSRYMGMKNRMQEDDRLLDFQKVFVENAIMKSITKQNIIDQKEATMHIRFCKHLTMSKCPVIHIMYAQYIFIILFFEVII